MGNKRNLQYFDARTATKQQVIDAVRADGACVVTHLIPPEAADAILNEMKPYVDMTSGGNDDFAGVNTTRTGALAARSPTFNKYCLLNPFLLACAEEFLLPWCKRFHVMATQLIRIGPNSPAQPFHRDRQAWGKDMLGEIVEPQMASVWALSDFTKEIGATRVVPGTHVRPMNYEYEPQEDEICYAEMPKGSAVFYTGSVIHSGGANVSNQIRSGMHLSFACGWLRQEENQYLSVPPEIARTLAPEIQELLGYSLADYALGYSSPPTVADKKKAASLINSHDAAPLGSDTLAPEIFLGRSPRPFNKSAGVRPDVQLAGSNVITTIYEDGKAVAVDQTDKLGQPRL